MAKSLVLGQKDNHCITLLFCSKNLGKKKKLEM
jgi:hypothetical protein